MDCRQVVWAGCIVVGAIACGTKFKNSSPPTAQFVAGAASPTPVPSPSPSSVIGGEKTGGGIVGSESSIATPKLISSQCDGSSKASSATDQVTAKGGSVVVKGEFCPSEFKKLNVVFMIDASASMDDNDTDEIKNNTCYRLDAAKALAKKIAESKRAGDTVNISVVRFSSAANNSDPAVIKVNNHAVDTFLSSDATVNNFCGRDGVLTNFEDGFDKTKTVLSPAGKLAEGNSVIYLITDGRPTDSNTSNDEEEDALAGVNRLYALGSSITVNALFVGSPGTRDRDFMGQLTKDPNRVLAATSASDIGAKLAEFAFPKTEVKEADLTATISSGSDSKTVKIAKFTIDSAKSIFSYELEPVTPYAQPNGKTKNTVKVVDRAHNLESVTEFEY